MPTNALSTSDLVAGVAGAGQPAARADPFAVGIGLRSCAAPALDGLALAEIAEPFPFRPKIGSSESLAWLTDLLRIEEQGNPHRRPAGAAPGLHLQLRARRTALHPRGAVRPAEEGDRRRRSRSGSSAPSSPVTSLAADTAIAFDTSSADYRAGAHIIVWQSDEVFATAVIDTVTAGGVTLTAPIGRDLVNPLAHAAEGRPLPEGPRHPPRQDLEQRRCRLRSERQRGPARPTPATTSTLTLDVLTDPPVMITDLSESVVQASDAVDGGSGEVADEPLRDMVDYTRTISFFEKGKAALWRRRQWLHARRGRQVAFWLPSFNNDLVPLAPIAALDTTITRQARRRRRELSRPPRDGLAEGRHAALSRRSTPRQRLRTAPTRSRSTRPSARPSIRTRSCSSPS